MDTIRPYWKTHSEAHLKAGQSPYVFDLRVRDPTERPVYSKPRRYPAAKMEALLRMDEERTRERKHTPGYSEWSSAVHLVPKKNGTYRWCNDIKDKQDRFIWDQYPVSGVKATLQSLGRAGLITNMDERWSYEQFPVSHETSLLLAASVPGKGQRRTLVGMMGVPGMESHLARRNDAILADIEGAHAYFDDWMGTTPLKAGTNLDVRPDSIESTTDPPENLSEHDYNLLADLLPQHLRAVVTPMLEQASLNNISFGLEKSVFATCRRKLLGYIIEGGYLKKDPSLVETIRNCRYPESREELRQSLAIFRTYHDFVKGFSTISNGLEAKTSTRVKFELTDEDKRNFDFLKNGLCSATMLLVFLRTRPTRVIGDASDYAIGAVLEQQLESGEWVPVCFGSKALRGAQINWHISEKELWVFVYFLLKWEDFLIDILFKAYTDHRALMWLARMLSATRSAKLTRWFWILSRFLMELYFLKGSRNHTDGLSREPVATRAKEDATVQALVTITEALLQRQLADPVLQQVIRAISGEDVSEAVVHSACGRRVAPSALKSLAKEVSLIDGRYVRRTETRDGLPRLQVWVPRDNVAALLKAAHRGPTGGHRKELSMANHVRRYHFVVHLKHHLKDLLATCEECQRAAAPEAIRFNRLKPLVVADFMDVLQVDTQGPLPTTERGNAYIFNAKEKQTGYRIMAAVPDIGMETMARTIVERVILRLGLFRTLHTDSHDGLLGRVMQLLTAKLDIHHHAAAPQNHQSIGALERDNASVIQALRGFCGHDMSSWDLHLPYVEALLNFTPRSNTGVSPFLQLTGRDAIDPIELVVPAQLSSNRPSGEPPFRWLTNLEAIQRSASSRLQQQADDMRKRSHEEHPPFEHSVGDMMWLVSESRIPGVDGRANKYTHKADGPFRIESVSPDRLHAELSHRDNKRNKQRVRVNRLVPFTSAPQWLIDRALADTPAPATSVTSVEEEEVSPEFNIDQLHHMKHREMRAHCYRLGLKLPRYRKKDMLVRLAPHATDSDEPPPEYVVESIIQSRWVDDHPMFEVSWKGYSAMHNTWQPIDSFTDINTPLPDYLEEHVNKRPPGEETNLIVDFLNRVKAQLLDSGGDVTYY